VKVWKRPQGNDFSKWECSLQEKMRDAVTAVDITRDPKNSRDLLAVGFEDGHIEIYAIRDDDLSSSQLLQHLNQDVAHVDQIHRLAWRSGPPGLQLASCSEDRSVRLLSFNEV